MNTRTYTFLGQEWRESLRKTEAEAEDRLIAGSLDQNFHCFIKPYKPRGWMPGMEELLNNPFITQTRKTFSFRGQY